MIYTSYFAHVKKLVGQHPHLKFVSIAGKTPDWFDGTQISILKYSKLAPKWDWWRIWHDKFAENLESEESRDWYREKYFSTVLSKLDPKKVRDELMELSDKYNVCLLCFETPEKFCHRHLVAEWLNDGGIECRELI